MKRSYGLAAVALAVMASRSLGAQGGKKASTGGDTKHPSMVRVQDDPALPRVLLIGDSISMGYTVPVREMLNGQANVHRIPENGGTTANGLKMMNAWLGEGKWDVIHFNWGLHDIKIMKEGKHQVPIEEYEKNLRTLVKKMKATGAQLIWASTTPVPEGKVSPERRKGDVVAYNAVAEKVMKENQISIDDLYGFALPRLKELQNPVNVHFSEKGSRALAEQVVASIRAHLGKGRGSQASPTPSAATPGR